MRKEKKQNLQYEFALQVKKHIPKDTAITTLAAQYGLSTSTISLIMRGKKNPELSTIWHISEMLGVYPDELLKGMRENLPKDFTMTDI